MMSLQHWSNDMHRLRRSQDEAHLVDPPTKTNHRTGGVCGAPVMVPTLDHSALTVAELIHSRTLIDLLWIISCLSTLSAKVQISSRIIKYQDSNVHLMNRLQRLYCRCGQLHLGSWKRGVDQWNNPSSTIPPEFDSTKRSLQSCWYGISVYLCRWVLVVLGHLKSSKIHQFLLKTGDYPTHFSPLCRGHLKKSEQLAVLSAYPLVSSICAKTRCRCNENTWQNETTSDPQIVSCAPG